MQVIEGKQAVLRPYLSEKQCAKPVSPSYVSEVPAVLRSYLTEEQCAKPVQGQLAASEKPVHATGKAPINYAVKNTSVKEVATSKMREHFVQAVEAQTLSVSEQSVQRAVVKKLPTVPLRSAAAAVGTGHIMDVTEEDDLTIGQLFSSKH